MRAGVEPKAVAELDAYSMSQNNLGWMYENGRGVAKDVVEAINWYRKGAEKGNVRAQNNLGIMYENGRGVEQDLAEATKWYRRAAEQGLTAAQDALTRLEMQSKRAE